MKAVQIEDDNLLDLGLGLSIYSKAQVEEFLKFQDSGGTRQAYLTETAELSYGGGGEDGSWGLGLGKQAREHHQRGGLVSGAPLSSDRTLVSIGRARFNLFR